MEKITAKELSRRLKLSPSAVSLAINGKPGVSEATRARVFDAALALGYQPPRAHSRTVSDRSYTVCVAYFIDFEVNFLAHSTMASYLLQGIESAAEKMNCHTMVRYVNSNHSIAAQAADILREAEAVLLLGTDIVVQNLPKARQLVDALSGIPLVVVDNSLFAGQLDCACNDNHTGARLAVEHLLAQGCRTFGYLRAIPRIQSNRIRGQGFRAALAEQGLSLDPVVDMPPFSEGGYANFRTWLSTASTLPDAFVSDHDVLAISAIRALNERGIAVPERVAVIGFDDIPAGRMILPSLSTVRTFKQALGASAMRCLFHRLHSNCNPLSAQQTGLLNITLSAQLQARGSTLWDARER